MMGHISGIPHDFLGITFPFNDYMTLYIYRLVMT
jgi:hypothetical protein